MATTIGPASFHYYKQNEHDPKLTCKAGHIPVVSVDLLGLTNTECSLKTQQKHTGNPGCLAKVRPLRKDEMEQKSI